MVNYFDDITKLNDSQRSLLEEYYHSARKFNVENAEKMLIKHYRCRKVLGMDTEEYKTYKIHPIMEKCYPHGRFKHDKVGRPVVYNAIGGIDAKGILMNTPSSDIYNAVIFWQEAARQCCAEASKQFGKRIEQVIFIVDLKGMDIQYLWKPGLDSFVETSHVLEQSTPEIMFKLFVINAPSIFPIIFKLVKPILDENTVQKIEIYGDNFKDGLLKWIDADQLPVCYGGTATNETDITTNFNHVVYSHLVPEELFLNKEQYLKFETAKQKEIKVKAGSFVQVPVKICEEGKILEWFIKSDSTNDFYFGIFRTETSSKETSIDKLEMVVPYFKVFTYFVPEMGKIKAKVGKYVFHFDNSHSWITGKNIKYVINVNDEDNETVSV